MHVSLGRMLVGTARRGVTFGVYVIAPCCGGSPRGFAGARGEWRAMSWCTVWRLTRAGRPPDV